MSQSTAGPATGANTTGAQASSPSQSLSTGSTLSAQPSTQQPQGATITGQSPPSSSSTGGPNPPASQSTPPSQSPPPAASSSGISPPANPTPSPGQSLPAGSTTSPSSGQPSTQQQAAATTAGQSPLTAGSTGGVNPPAGPTGGANLSAGQSTSPGPSQPTASASTLVSPPTGRTPKILVLCFDGTGNKFGKNSNVVRLMHALEKDNPEAQVVYYQPGIGTYLNRKFATKFFSSLYAQFETAFARGLGDHVKDGYKFLMQYYKPGDKICLFGFSRGAYTARALSGMIYKVGLLLPGNDQQLDFAYEVYKNTNREGAVVAREFKETFSIPVKVHFLGVWDTVASVGLIPRSLPYSTQNDGVEHFRHALALDERRARFRPNLWGEPIASREELDTIPELLNRNKVSRDAWVYKPPAVSDVKEVWFAGAHADVGGGSHEATHPTSLSRIPLRWMIRECFLTGTGILFNKERLKANTELDSDALTKFPRGVHIHNIPVSQTRYTAILPNMKIASNLLDVMERIYDQLELAVPWWILEFLPHRSVYQKQDGSYAHWRQRNYGNGRLVPEAEPEILVHRSVDARIKQTESKYLPSALNWDRIVGLNGFRWVD